MRLLVVGAGSIGGYYGGRLAVAGRDVTFLVRPVRATKLRDNGLTIVSPHGNANLHPKLTTAGTLARVYDVVWDAGIEAPLLGVAYANLCVYQNRITAG
jgi:2-dehydropantoate 2-reductase